MNKTLIEFEPGYFISPEGEVFKKQKGNTHKTKGFVSVGCNNSTYFIHRLVAQYYLNEGVPLKTFVGFIDGDKQNVSVTNLFLGDKSSIIRHRKEFKNKIKPVRRKKRKQKIEYGDKKMSIAEFAFYLGTDYFKIYNRLKGRLADGKKHTPNEIAKEFRT